jgi:hypothetical protein
MVMGAIVSGMGICLQKSPRHFLFAIQILSGVGIYASLLIYSQKMLVSEIKEMVWHKKVSA